eukprot:4847145-Pyramimonas_sp.AAC.1
MIPRGCAMGGTAWRRRAPKSTSCHSMARLCVVKYCITEHSTAKHGIAHRYTTQHRIVCRGMA